MYVRTRCFSGSVIVILIASACVWGEKDVIKKQRVRVETDPANASIETRQPIRKPILAGKSPVDVEADYEVTVNTFNPLWWIASGSSIALAGLGGGLVAAGDDARTGGIALLAISAVPLLYFTLNCIVAHAQADSEVREDQLDKSVLERRGKNFLEIEASADGYLSETLRLKVPVAEPKAFLKLKPLEDNFFARRADYLKSQAPDSGPIAIAVFPIEAPETLAGDVVMMRLSDVLVSGLIRHSGCRILDGDSMEKRLQAMSSEGIRACISRECRFSLSKALAAQKVLSTEIVKVGSKCAVTSTLFDISREVSDIAASVRTTCDQSGLESALESVVKQVVTGKFE